MDKRFAVVLVILAFVVGSSCRRNRSAGVSATSSGSRATAEPGTVGVPSAAELDAFVTGAGGVHLGMTESEVSDELGAKPTRRQEATSPGASTDVVWDRIGGARPGGALGSFLEGRLVRIEYAPAGKPDLPRLDRTSAESLTRAEYVRRSVDRSLRMADIEAVTRGPGCRASWIIGRGSGGKTTVMSRWLWEVEPGGQALIVEEEDGLVDQPIIRSMK
jgi:hypothetical protein